MAAYNKQLEETKESFFVDAKKMAIVDLRNKYRSLISASSMNRWMKIVSDKAKPIDEYLKFEVSPGNAPRQIIDETPKILQRFKVSFVCHESGIAKVFSLLANNPDCREVLIEKVK